MTITYLKEIPRGEQTHAYIEAYSDNVPDPMPTGADVSEYEDYDQIAVGSWIYIVSTGVLYMANEDGTFVEQ